MITTSVNEKGEKQLSFSFPEISDVSMLTDLRDALMQALEACVSYEDAKDATQSFTLYLLTRMIAELNKDIDALNSKK